MPTLQSQRTSQRRLAWFAGSVGVLCSTACSLVLPRDSELLGGGGDAGADAGMLLFDEEFDGAVLDLNKWAVAGDGVWSIDGGTGVQSNSNTTTSMIYARAFVAATDYHIVTRMRSTGPFGQGLHLAPEIAFRVDPTVDAGGIPETYRCDFDLFQSQLIFGQTAANNAPDLVTADIVVPSNFDEGTPFVFDAVVSGAGVTCTVTVDNLGVVGRLSTNLLGVGMGSFGLKTYDTSAQFFYFRVYAAD
jgi:hypothetical protein